MGKPDPPRRYMVSREVARELIENHQSAWRAMGDLIRDGADRSAQYALWLEHKAELEIVHQQSESGRFHPPSIAEIRNWMVEHFGKVG